MQFLIFVDEPFFNEPGFQASQNTEKGQAASKEYNAPIRIQTLRLAYLDHIKTLNASATIFSSEATKGRNACIDRAKVSMVRRNWRDKGGREVAQKWATDCSDIDSKTIVDLIEKIDIALATLESSKLLS